MRTLHTDHKWLSGTIFDCFPRYQIKDILSSDPTFIGSYEIDRYVYFFYRETATEHSSCGNIVYSRVARICKAQILLESPLKYFSFLQNDRGGRQVLKQNWATFIKARLNCSLPGEYPFYFDQLGKEI